MKNKSISTSAISISAFYKSIASKSVFELHDFLQAVSRDRDLIDNVASSRMRRRYALLDRTANDLHARIAKIEKESYDVVAVSELQVLQAEKAAGEAHDDLYKIENDLLAFINRNGITFNPAHPDASDNLNTNLIVTAQFIYDEFESSLEDWYFATIEQDAIDRAKGVEPVLISRKPLVDQMFEKMSGAPDKSDIQAEPVKNPDGSIDLEGAEIEACGEIAELFRSDYLAGRISLAVLDNTRDCADDFEDALLILARSIYDDYSAGGKNSPVRTFEDYKQNTPQVVVGGFGEIDCDCAGCQSAQAEAVEPVKATRDEILKAYHASLKKGVQNGSYTQDEAESYYGYACDDLAFIERSFAELLGVNCHWLDIQIVETEYFAIVRDSKGEAEMIFTDLGEAKKIAQSCALNAVEPDIWQVWAYNFKSKSLIDCITHFEADTDECESRQPAPVIWTRDSMAAYKAEPCACGHAREAHDSLANACYHEDDEELCTCENFMMDALTVYRVEVWHEKSNTREGVYNVSQQPDAKMAANQAWKLFTESRNGRFSVLDYKFKTKQVQG
jgi:hypothetical protein